jgi:tetratricopeptide (TPR) repeat protein
MSLFRGGLFGGGTGDLKSGLARLEAGDADGALPSLNRAVARMPKDARARYARARAHAARGDLAAAERDFGAAVGLDPHWALPRFGRAWARLRAGDAEAPRTTPARRSRSTPRADGWFNRAQARVRLGDVAGAVADLGEPPNAPDLGRAALERARLRRAQRDSRAPRRLRRGARARGHDAPRPAGRPRRQQRAARGRRPRGRRRRPRGGRRAAPAAVPAWCALGHVRLAGATRRAPPPRSTGPRARPVARGRLVRAGDRQGGARRRGRRAPRPRTRHGGRARHVRRVVRRGHRNAREGAGRRAADFGRAVDRDPTSALALLARADAQASLGDPHGALSDYDAALAFDRTLLEGWVNRAVVRATVGDLVGAAHDLSQALVLDPGSLDLLEARGEARWALGDADGAVGDWDRVVERAPARASTRRLRGAARLSYGDEAGAAADLARFLEVAADDPEAAAVRDVVEALRERGVTPGAAAA